MRKFPVTSDISGQKFNHLTAVKLVSRKPTRWLCLCDCGNYTTVLTSNLKSGAVKSCGCIAHKGNPKHNQCYTRVYRIYAKILRRCFSHDDPAYSHYGGRGITMCEEWKNSFSAFSKWAYENGYRDNLTIDRIDNNGDYCPENCRWASYYEQSNNRRSNRVYTYKGKTKDLKQWCDELGVSYKTIYARISRGWSFEDAVNWKHDARVVKRKEK